jgi:hypothetical protein
MARLEVTGTVARIFYENKGADIVEYFPKKDGSTGEKKFKAWFDQPQSFVVGDAVTVSGLHSAVIEDWTDKDGNPKLDHTGKQGRSVVVSINNAHARIESTEFNAAVTAAATFTTPAVGDDAPF